MLQLKLNILKVMKTCNTQINCYVTLPIFETLHTEDEDTNDCLKICVWCGVMKTSNPITNSVDNQINLCVPCSIQSASVCIFSCSPSHKCCCSTRVRPSLHAELCRTTSPWDSFGLSKELVPNWNQQNLRLIILSIKEQNIANFLYGNKSVFACPISF